MKRDLGALSSRSYDLVVIGGGIHGAWAAWEGALRGLSVAFIEQDDFGGATSANSQRIIHGGLRYLQSFDLKRTRESIRERLTLLRVAPHFVRPMPCVMPTYGYVGLRGCVALRVALAANDAVGWDRNRGIDDPARRVPPGRMLSRAECLQLAPGIIEEGVSGGALWYDGRADDTERLTLSVVLSAARAGAAVANYARVDDFVWERGRITGVIVEDALDGRRSTVRARMVLNTTGPWINRLLNRSGEGSAPLRTQFVKAFNLVTCSITPMGVALALASRRAGSRVPGLLFITPWRDGSIVGTAFSPFAGEPEEAAVGVREIDELVMDVNAAYPAARLRLEDVRGVHVGLLPSAAGSSVPYARRSRIMDHERLHGVGGLMSVLGIKYTTARGVAEQALDLVCGRLGHQGPRGLSRTTPLLGGAIESVERLVEDAVAGRPSSVSAEAARELVLAYGTSYREVLAHLDEDPTWARSFNGSSRTLAVQVIHAVRQEGAVRLSDVVFRRTALGTAGHPGQTALRACAELMTPELGWNAARVAQELSVVEAAFARRAVESPVHDEPVRAAVPVAGGTT